jgi:hypothetical protein
MACRQARMRDGHSSRTPVARRLQQPTRTGGSGHRSSRLRAFAEGGTPSLFGLAPGGVCRAAGVAAGAVRSYRTVSPLPRQNTTHRGGLFSVALSLGSHPPDVIRHGPAPALPSPRFSRGSGGAPNTSRADVLYRSSHPISGQADSRAVGPLRRRENSSRGRRGLLGVRARRRVAPGHGPRNLDLVPFRLGAGHGWRHGPGPGRQPAFPSELPCASGPTNP